MRWAPARPKFVQKSQPGDVAHAPTGYKKVSFSHNEAFQGEQGRLPSSSKNGLRARRSALAFTEVGRGAGLRVSTLREKGLVCIDFLWAPKEGVCALLNRLAQMWVQKGRGRDEAWQLLAVRRESDSITFIKMQKRRDSSVLSQSWPHPIWAYMGRQWEELLSCSRNKRSNTHTAAWARYPLSILHILTRLILTPTLWERCTNYSKFIEKKTEAQWRILPKVTPSVNGKARF